MLHTKFECSKCGALTCYCNHTVPVFEVVEVAPDLFQVNELRTTERPVFVGLRKSRAEANATVAKLAAEYGIGGTL